MTDATFAPALPHGPIEEVFDEVFVVRGTHRMAPLLEIPRTMTIVREGGSLTLLNAIRLGDDGERALAKLGRVENVVKLGHHHGVDHPYYVKRHGARLWATPDATHGGDVGTDERLEPRHLPIDATLFRFERSRLPEAALIVERAGGVLVTCDSVQSWPDLRGCSLLGKIVCGAMGFVGIAQIGPGWRKACEPRDDLGFAPDFERLLALEFRHLVDGHGVPQVDDGKEKLAATVERAFGGRRGAQPARAA